MSRDTTSLLSTRFLCVRLSTHTCSRKSPPRVRRDRATTEGDRFDRRRRRRRRRLRRLAGVPHLSCHRRLFCRNTQMVPEEGKTASTSSTRRLHHHHSLGRRQTRPNHRPNENSRCSRKTARTRCIATEKSCPSYSRWEVPYTLQMCSGTALFPLSTTSTRLEIYHVSRSA